MGDDKDVDSTERAWVPYFCGTGTAFLAGAGRVRTRFQWHSRCRNRARRLRGSGEGGRVTFRRGAVGGDFVMLAFAEAAARGGGWSGRDAPPAVDEAADSAFSRGGSSRTPGNPPPPVMESLSACCFMGSQYPVAGMSGSFRRAEHRQEAQSALLGQQFATCAKDNHFQPRERLLFGRSDIVR